MARQPDNHPKSPPLRTSPNHRKPITHRPRQTENIPRTPPLECDVNRSPYLAQHRFLECRSPIRRPPHAPPLALESDVKRGFCLAQHRFLESKKNKALALCPTPFPFGILHQPSPIPRATPLSLLPSPLFLTLKTSNAAPESSNATPETSNIAPESSNSALETSNIAPETSNIASESSNTAPESSNTAPETSNIALETSNTAPETSNATPESSNTASETSNIALETSNTAPETSNIAPESFNIASATSDNVPFKPPILRSHIKHRKHKEKIAPASPKRQPPSPHPILSHVLIAKLSIHKSARLH
ncbi:MAG: hypothetical protein NZM04_10025, partial [Methylacidiphilales bacterium]|nr:hypothetical protein [Candidatus Methylacidiphilales bacterium]